MADKDNTQKEMTPEEVAEKSLTSEAYQRAYGLTLVQDDPTKYGGAAYQGARTSLESIMEDDELTGLKKAMYDQKKREGQEAGVEGEPSPVTNYDVQVRVARAVKEGFAVIGDLGKLEGIVKNVAPDLKFEVPEELKSMKVADIAQKQAGKESLTDYEKDALGAYQVLTEAYGVATAEKVAREGLYADVNGAGLKLAEKYKPQEKEFELAA